VFHGGENWKSLRIWNVYVRWSVEIAGMPAAISGLRRDASPSSHGVSGWFKSFAQVAYSSCQALVMYASPGSTCHDAPTVPILNVSAVPVGVGDAGIAAAVTNAAMPSANTVAMSEGLYVRGLR
jgi:hypothetical protein